MKNLSVLITFECSGVIREAFRALGHDAESCDLKPAEDGSPHHIQGDALVAMRAKPRDLFICHPPCPRLALSGVLRLYFGGKKSGGLDPVKMFEMRTAAELFRVLFHIAPETPLGVENPRQHGFAMRAHGVRIRPQVIHPHHFGHDASKQTLLWLRGLPPLIRTHADDDLFAEQGPRPRIVDGLPRYANQTDSGNNKLTPSLTRSTDRSRTYPGIAAAMAAQWSEFLAK